MIDTTDKASSRLVLERYGAFYCAAIHGMSISVRLAILRAA